MRIAYGTKIDNIKTISKIAEESFSNHKIVSEQTDGPVQMWYCGRDGTGMYHFRVVSAPCMLLVYGDVGNYILQASDCDLIPWIKQAINSRGYIIGKIVNKGQVFRPDEADDILTNLYNEFQEDEYYNGMNNINSIRENWDKNHDGLEKFGEEILLAGFDTELIEQSIDYDEDVYWTYECLKKFVELLNEDNE